MASRIGSDFIEVERPQRARLLVVDVAEGHLAGGTAVVVGAHRHRRGVRLRVGHSLVQPQRASAPVESCKSGHQQQLQANDDDANCGHGLRRRADGLRRA